MKSIYLVGFMGSGKSTIGKLLADKLNLNYLDTDEEIEVKAKKKIKEIFADDGESAFRDLEHQILKSTSTSNYVISTGGGMIDREENRQWLNDKQVVYLKTSWETVSKRLQNDQNRPIWQDESRDKLELLANRDPKYRQVSSTTIETDHQTIEQIVEQISSIFV